jgi:anti-anti-sigma regulatory factor
VSVARFEIVENCLMAYGDAAALAEEPLRNALDTLLAKDGVESTIDLTNLTYMSSSCLSQIAMAIIRASSQDRRVTVRAGAKIMRLFKIAGVTALGTFEAVG